MSAGNEGKPIASPDDTLDIALSLARAGWYVFPVKLVPVERADGTMALDKRPLVKWLEGATRDAEQIATWWAAEFPGAWVGVNAARSGIVIVDLDKSKPHSPASTTNPELWGKEKGSGKANLKAAKITLPDTLNYKTKSGGRHYVYRAPKDTALTIGRDHPVAGVDIRAGNGLMVYYGPRLEGPPVLAKAPKWALLKAKAKSGAGKHDLDTEAWLKAQRDGKPGKEVRKVLKGIGDLKHDAMLEAVNTLVRAGSGGAPGMAPVLEAARAAYIEGRPDRARDWDNAVTGSVRHFGLPPTTLDLPKRDRKAVAKAKKRHKAKSAAKASGKPGKALSEAHAAGTVMMPPLPDNPQHGDIGDGPLSVDIAGVLSGEWAYTEATGLIRWTGKVWERSTSMGLIERVRDELAHIEVRKHDKAVKNGDKGLIAKLPSLLSAKKARDVAALVTGILAEARLEPDAHPDLINTQSGVLDLRTLELGPHDPALLLTKITAAAYVPGARSADWDAALSAITPKVAAWLQVRMGQAITGHMTPDDLLPLYQGSGENGKSTWLDATRVAVGDYAVTVPERLLLSNPGDHPTELTTLMGARFAVIEELPEGRNLNVKRLKDAVGTPVITARRIRQDNVTWRATHSLMLSTNYLPVVAETDHGTWRRLALVVFPFKFVAPVYDEDGNEVPYTLGKGERRGDPDLRHRLGEAPSEAVLAWLAEGAHRWYANGMPGKPKAVARDTDAWRAEADPIMAYFDERLELSDHYAIPSADLGVDFNDWLSHRGHKEWSQQTINARLAGHELFAEVVRKKASFSPKLMPSRPGFTTKPVAAGTAAWVGVKFKSTIDADPFAAVVRDYEKS